MDASAPPRSAFPVVRTVPTRWADNDHYGHVNNVVHYALFDTTVNAHLIEATATDIRKLPAIGLVVETSCRYLAPVSFPDVLHVGLAAERVGERSITYLLGLFREDEQAPSAVGRFVHVYVDREQRSSCAVPEEIRRVVADLHLRAG